jgi:autoinducer 2-degrading protein
MEDDAMYVVCVTVKVKPGMEENFITATIDNARGTRKEPGNVRFDVLRGEEDGTQFFLYEVYRSKDAFTAHQQTPHYLKWRDTVKDWMAEPRKGVRHTGIFPESQEDW